MPPKRKRPEGVTRRLVEKQGRVDADMRKRMGSLIRSLREERGLTQNEFAKDVGQEYFTFISQVENGGSRVPSDDMGLWAQALGVDPVKFARACLRYYDPGMFAAVFPNASEEPEL